MLQRLMTLIIISMTVTGCQTSTQSTSKAELPLIDRIVVEKSKHTISVFKDDEELAKYKVSLGKSPVGHKEKEGDHKTPEGIYTIVHKNPDDHFYKSMTISYPNDQDRENAEK